MTDLPPDEPAGAANAGSGVATLPFDVQQMLALHGAALPHYFDAQRQAAMQRSRADWPCLWRMAPTDP